MEHEASDTESDNDDVVDKDKVVQSTADNNDDHSEPDWRQFAAAYRCFQLDTTQELLTSNLFTAIKSMKEYVTRLLSLSKCRQKMLQFVVFVVGCLRCIAVSYQHCHITSFGGAWIVSNGYAV